MRFAVIAAGEGSRLAQEGVEQPKPLVPLCGEPMIERLLRIFVDCGATEIVVIVNEWSTAVREHLEQMQLPVPLRLVVKTTPSSMHSLHALSPYLRGERFCLTTVDTIFREEEFKKYIRYFQEAKEIDGCMAVTPYVDDEKPLWVGVEKQADAEGASLLDKQGSHKKPRITGFHDKQEGDDHLISGGIYCLGDKALDVLGRIEEEGVLVVNSSLGVNRCIRRIMTERFIAGGIATPESRIIGRNEEMVKDIHYPCWLKRGDGCAQQKEDTCYVQNEQEAEALLKEFWLRGITSVVVNEHLKGDLIKFYGVSGTDFFYWFYPSKCGHRSKFGLEVINGEAQGIAFDAEDLKAEADKAADMLNVPVYGGDCVVSEDGSIRIIDFNDWPSFAPCRDEAAFYIATKMIQE